MDFSPPPDARPDDRPWPRMEWPDPTRALICRHVQLTRTEPDDAPELFRALDDDRVWAHVRGRPADADELAATIRTAEAGGRFLWTVTSVDGRIVGTTSYLEVVPTDARLEIGHTLYAPDVWGTVVNPATKLLLLDHAFTDLGAGRVQFKTDVRNERSQRAVARLGAGYEGTLRRYQRRTDGTVRDTVLFAVTPEDWPDVRAGLQHRLG